MASRSWQLPSQIAAEPFVVAMTAVLAMALAFVAIGRDFGRVSHEAMLTTLRTIDASHALLQRDVLRARAGFLTSYDPLVASIVSLKEAPPRLALRIREEALDDDGYLVQPLDRLKSSIDTDERLIERFKTMNALLQNSTAVFGRTLTALHGSRNEQVRIAMSGVGDLGNLMMRFAMTTTDRMIEAVIRQRIEQLARSDAASQAPDIQTLIVHAGVVLAMLPAVDATIMAIYGSRTLSHAEQLQERYLEILGRAASQNAVSRAILGATAVVLWFCVLLFIFRLRRQTEYLERRLQLENAIAGIKSRIHGARAEEFEEHMQEGLLLLSLQFAVEKIQLAILDSEQGDIVETHCSHGEFSTDLTLIQEFTADLRRPATDGALADGWSQGDADRLIAGSVWSRRRNSTHAIAGTVLPDARVGILMVQFANPRTRPCPFIATLLETAVPPLAELVASSHARREKLLLEQRLEQAQRLEALGTLAGGIAHEFNNILGSILGYSEMALQILRKSSAARVYVEKVLASGDRAKRVIDQVLAFSRKRDRPSRPFDLIEAIADFQPLLQVTLADKVGLHLSLPAHPATIEGHPIEFQQVLLNLCKNAMEASARGQHVELDVTPVRIAGRMMLSHGEISSGSYFCLAVRDRGVGIDEAKLPHIFEPFYTTKSHSGGTGLGLAAVHGLVAGLRGAINVVSDGASGTTFEVYLPASDRPPLPIKSFYGERSTPIGNGQRVAILERDTFLLRMHEEKVAALGYEPLGCASVDEMLSALATPDGRPDMAMLDRESMGDQSGVAKISAALRDLPTIIVADRDRSRELNRLAPSDGRILGKPINSRALAQALFDCLQS